MRFQNNLGISNIPAKQNLHYALSLLAAIVDTGGGYEYGYTAFCEEENRPWKGKSFETVK